MSSKIYHIFSYRTIHVNRCQCRPHNIMKERLILIYFLAFIRPLTCEVKIWTQSTSLGDPQQWEEERLPCLGQSIVLPEEVMFVPNQFKFGPETILPNDGMLLFQQGLICKVTRFEYYLFLPLVSWFLAGLLEVVSFCNKLTRRVTLDRNLKTGITKTHAL